MVGLEKPDLSGGGGQMNQLLVKINADKNQLNAIEDRIRKLPFESQGIIMDNKEPFNILVDSKIIKGGLSDWRHYIDTLDFLNSGFGI